MPRSAEEIFAHADELAKQFEDHEPDPANIKDAQALRDIAQAFSRLAASERELADAVSVARAEGHSWAAIGAMLGTSGEAARQRYSSLAHEPRKRQPRRRASA
jgi:DNA-directed RNA polymerase specialized sigma24 family protein